MFNFRKSNTNITDLLSDLSDCDVIIEAIIEDVDAKTRLFSKLDHLVREDAIVVSNSSSIKPSLMIRDVRRIECYAGLHFFHPVKYKNIVEVITTCYTSDAVLDLLKKFLSAIDKFFLVMHENDGFILNKIFLGLQAQAYRYYEDGIVSISDIDSIVRKYLFPIGVFEFIDRVGIDVMYQSVNNYTEDLSEREFYLPLVEGMKKMIQKNRLGQKNSAGFYDYPKAYSVENSSCSEDLHREISFCLLGLYINSAFKALEKNICGRDSLEYAIKEYMGVEKGPFELAEEIGGNRLREELLKHYDNTGFDVFWPSYGIKSL
jgi:3-hydroxybutyryl-CoA dehydrogenase